LFSSLLLIEKKGSLKKLLSIMEISTSLGLLSQSFLWPLKHSYSPRLNIFRPFLSNYSGGYPMKK